MHDPHNPLETSKPQTAYKLIELPNSALYTLLDSLLVAIRRGDLDGTLDRTADPYNNYCDEYGLKFGNDAIFRVSFNIHPKTNFLLWNFGEEMEIAARCYLHATRTYFTLSGIFHKDRNGCWITKTGEVQLKEIHLALVEREKIIASKLKEQGMLAEKQLKGASGELAMAIAENIDQKTESNSRDFRGGGGMTKTEIREMFRKEDEEKLKSKEGGIFKTPHLDGTVG